MKFIKENIISLVLGLFLIIAIANIVYLNDKISYLKSQLEDKNNQNDERDMERMEMRRLMMDMNSH